MTPICLRSNPSLSPPHRVGGSEQATLGDQEHGQAGPGDGGAAPPEGLSGGGQGDPAGPAEQRADPEGPGHREYHTGRGRNANRQWGVGEDALDAFISCVVVV